MSEGNDECGVNDIRTKRPRRVQCTPNVNVCECHTVETSILPAHVLYCRNNSSTSTRFVAFNNVLLLHIRPPPGPHLSRAAHTDASAGQSAL